MSRLGSALQPKGNALYHLINLTTLELESSHDTHRGACAARQLRARRAAAAEHDNRIVVTDIDAAAAEALLHTDPVELERYAATARD